MLSEAYLLADALKRAGITPDREHPRVKLPGKSGGPCLRIRLGAKGQVTAVEDVTDEEWPNWTIREGNQNSFPVVRLTDPIVTVPNGDHFWQKLRVDAKGKREKKKIPLPNHRSQMLTDALAAGHPTQADEDFWRRLREKAFELWKYSTPGTGTHSAIRDFSRRFIRAARKPEKLLKAITATAVEAAGKERLHALDAVELLVVGTAPDERGERAAMKIQLVFDLDDRSLFSCEMRSHIIGFLPAEREADPNDEEGMTPCSFTGTVAERQTTAFPKVWLPILNKDFSLVSMFSDAPCNTRYRLTDAYVVPVSKSTARQIQDAMAYVVDKSREGKTWRGVASGKFEMARGRKVERRDLLIAYVDGKPDLPAQLVELFGSGEAEEQKQFEVDSSAVCEALDGIERAHPGSRVNLFVLRKVSEGQAQVAIAESPSVKEVLDAATQWREGARNVPEITVPLPKTENRQAGDGTPRTPYPGQVVRLLEYQWVRDGSSPRTGKGRPQKPNHEVQGISYRQVLDVMLRREGRWEATTDQMLHLTVQRLGPLLIGLFGMLQKVTPGNWKPLDDYPPSSRETALLAASTMGILLHSIGRKKEVYMTETGFLVGRLLALADTLHREYCRLVRKNSIPPQLIGNSLMPVAADNPQDAVDRLRERMNIYKAWADKGDGEDIRLAKWAVGQMGDVCRQLAEQSLLPKQTDAAFRAELFLGYMARLAKAVNEKTITN
jgi:hypothetical protein